MPTEEKMLRLKGSTYTENHKVKQCKRSFTIINIFMSVQRVHFPLTPAPLLKVKENDDSVELVIKNTSTFNCLKFKKIHSPGQGPLPPSKTVLFVHS
jgi:hypothetical protein